MAKDSINEGLKLKTPGPPRPNLNYFFVPPGAFCHDTPHLNGDSITVLFTQTTRSL
jgi:hypothetical protein